MKRHLLLALAALPLAACGASDSPGDDGPDAGPVCTTFISFNPASPIASPTTVVRADAGLQNATGVVTFTWKVTFEGTTITPGLAASDGSAITFPAVDPGVYIVDLRVSTCPDAQAELNVKAPNANQIPMRLRVMPPASEGVPPFEKLVVVLGGADFSLGPVTLDPGIPVAATVRSGATGVAAYLRLMPVASPEAAVEAFASSGGVFSARLQPQPHDVLVVPTIPGYAPEVVKTWQPVTASIDLAGGSTVMGTVRRSDGTAVVGAKVQLKIGDVPSTVAITTAPNGSFSLLARTAGTGPVTVDVTPPDGSGLPRLLAQSMAFDLDELVEVSYAALTLRNLGGARIERGTPAMPLGGAKVTVVGKLTGAGSVRTGPVMMPVAALGVVRIAATANVSGVLPSMLAPARQLSAVIEVSPSDHAVTAIDLTSTAPNAINAPALVQLSTEIRKPDGTTPITGALLDAVPVGDLALAGVTSSIRARSGAAGAIAVNVASGGHYDLRIHDPVEARGAPRLASDVTGQTEAASYALRPALKATGKLLLQGSPTPIGGAAVQLLCAQCTGLDRDRPLAESTSLPDGTFTLVAPDPGTN